MLTSSSNSHLSFSALWSFGTVTSTMEVARALSSRFEPGEVGLVVARQQTAGRGRQGRVWLSAEGAFLGTYIFSLSIRPLELRGFSLVVGLVLHQVLAQRGIYTALKWPNDLLSDNGGKIAGVLIEVIPARHGIGVLCGIGCNLEGAPEEVEGSVSVNQLGARLSRYDLIREMTPILLDHTSRFVKEGFEVFRQKWLSSAYRPAANVAVRVGDEQIVGSWRGVTCRGELVILDTNGKERVISSGEMVIGGGEG